MGAVTFRPLDSPEYKVLTAVACPFCGNEIVLQGDIFIHPKLPCLLYSGAIWSHLPPDYAFQKWLETVYPKKVDIVRKYFESPLALVSAP